MISPTRSTPSAAAMSAVRVPPASLAAGGGGRRLVAGLGAAGGALVVIGSLLPWVSLYAGLQSIAGTDGLNGRILAGLGVASALCALAHAAHGGPATRWLLGIAGFAVLAFGGWLGIQLLQTEALLAADPLLVARLEPGLAASLVGGALLLSTLFVPARSVAVTGEKQRRARSAAQFILVAALAVAGVVHLALVSEHLRESIALGVGFLGAGLGQIGLAVAILWKASTVALRSALLLSTASLAALAAAVTVGLPAFLHGSMTGVLAPAETLTDLGAITGAAEVIAVMLSARLLARRTSPA